MRYMRPVILHIFQRNSSKIESDYKIILNVVFNGRIPKKIKNFPSFSEKNKLEEMLQFHFLTTDGIDVIIYKPYEKFNNL